MFKNVTWSGFDARPDLKRLAEARLTDVAAELGILADQVDIEFALREVQPEGPYLAVTLTLVVSGLSVSQQGLVQAAWLSPGPLFMRVVRSIWGIVLDRLLDLLARRVKSDLVEAAGV